ncbi:hypothetical protein SO802_007265 [Lithocarpus litseifolius]|uniref:Uncharacterized protein n=1 Tax=Lithocarpus litseifolius TaxID=425828 RepID=A0AAW2DN40_9ROSI
MTIFENYTLTAIDFLDSSSIGFPKGKELYKVNVDGAVFAVVKEAGVVVSICCDDWKGNGSYEQMSQETIGSNGN